MVPLTNSSIRFTFMKRIILSFIFLSCCFGSFSQKNIKVYVFLAEECPVCNFVASSLSKTSDQFLEDVDFIAVFPQRISNIKTASLFKKKYGLTNFEIKIDKDQTITSKYNASITPEVIVVDENDHVLYKGRINNSYAAPGRMKHGKVKEDLRINLKNIINKQAIAKPWPEPIGCYITRING